MPATCEICGRPEGCTLDLGGLEDGVPLGPVTLCDLCGRRACPDCLHEADCCFDDADLHADDPLWAPRGWRRLPQQEPNLDVWERL
jgi:hypothetical protein